MKTNVWILGSSNMDVTYRVGNIPLKGSTVKAEACITATGGKGANQAAAAAHWGANVNFIGAVGNDPNGRLLLDALTSRGINVDCVKTVEDTPSGNAVIFVDDKGGNCITVYPGANSFVPTGMKPGFEAGDILVSQLEVNLDAVEYYFKLAREMGVFTVLNPSPFAVLPEGLLKSTNMIVANETEACELGGTDAVDSTTAVKCAQRIIDKGPGIVVITLGKAGAVSVSQTEAFHVPEYKVEVVDTQGAGDAFLGTLAARLSQGSSLRNAVSFANVVAALSVTQRGSTQVSLPPADIEAAGKYENYENLIY